MSQSDKLVGAVGLVRVAGLEVTVTPLSQAEELALDRALRRAAEAAAGDYYTRCRAELEALRQSPPDRAEFLRELARLSVTRPGLSPAALHEFRLSAPGVAIELYHRGKRATPGLTLAGLEAVVTPANADEVADGLWELLEGRGGDPDTKS